MILRLASYGGTAPRFCMFHKLELLPLRPVEHTKLRSCTSVSLGVGAWQAYSMQHSDRRKHTQAKYELQCGCGIQSFNWMVPCARRFGELGHNLPTYLQWRYRRSRPNCMGRDEPKIERSSERISGHSYVSVNARYIISLS